MTEFVYFADTHVGASEAGYRQQPRYVERLPEILEALRRWLDEHRNVEFALHGGDMVDSASYENIAAAAALFGKLPIPTWLCLGNHDLTDEKSLEMWMSEGRYFFKDGSPCFTVASDEAAVHIFPCDWCGTPYFWNIAEQTAGFPPERLAALDASLAEQEDKPQVLLTHNPVFGLPTEQTGFDAPHHAPAPDFRRTVLDVAERHPSLKVVLGAHNHMNMRISRGGVDYVTASALPESPFEFKHFKIDSDGISMATVSLAADLEFKADYDYDKTYVQGRPRDRIIAL